MEKKPTCCHIPKHQSSIKPLRRRRLAVPITVPPRRRRRWRLAVAITIPSRRRGSKPRRIAPANEIVFGALPIVDQDLVSLRRQLESEGGAVPDLFVRLRVAIWVEFEGASSEGLFDLLFGGGAAQS